MNYEDHGSNTAFSPKWIKTTIILPVVIVATVGYVVDGKISSMMIVETTAVVDVCIAVVSALVFLSCSLQNAAVTPIFP